MCWPLRTLNGSGSYIASYPVYDLGGLESGSEVETESLKHSTAGSKSENHDIGKNNTFRNKGYKKMILSKSQLCVS